MLLLKHDLLIFILQLENLILHLPPQQIILMFHFILFNDSHLIISFSGALCVRYFLLQFFNFFELKFVQLATSHLVISLESVIFFFFLFFLIQIFIEYHSVVFKIQKLEFISILRQFLLRKMDLFPRCIVIKVVGSHRRLLNLRRIGVI